MDSEEELNEILTREDETVDVLAKIDFFSNPVNITFTSPKSSEARVKLPNFEIPKFNGNIIKIAIHDNENINEV